MKIYLNFKSQCCLSRKFSGMADTAKQLMKHEDEAQSCTSKTEKKEARKNTFSEPML